MRQVNLSKNPPKLLIDRVVDTLNPTSSVFVTPRSIGPVVKALCSVASFAETRSHATRTWTALCDRVGEAAVTSVMRKTTPRTQGRFQNFSGVDLLEPSTPSNPEASPSDSQTPVSSARNKGGAALVAAQLFDCSTTDELHHAIETIVKIGVYADEDPSEDLTVVNALRKVCLVNVPDLSDDLLELISYRLVCSRHAHEAFECLGVIRRSTSPHKFRSLLGATLDEEELEEVLCKVPLPPPTTPAKPRKLPPLKPRETTVRMADEPTSYAIQFADKVSKAKLEDAHAMTAAVQLCSKLVKDAAIKGDTRQLPLMDMTVFLTEIVHRDKRSNILKLALETLSQLAITAGSLVDCPMWDFALKGACSHIGSSDRFLKDMALTTVSAICQHAKARSCLLVLLGVLSTKMKPEAIVACLQSCKVLLSQVEVTRNISEKLTILLFQLSNHPIAQVRQQAKSFNP